MSAYFPLCSALPLFGILACTGKPAAGCFFFTDASKFYSSYISATQRLPNGNMLITEGSDGRLIEVTPDHKIVWEYINPYFNNIFGKFINNMV